MTQNKTVGKIGEQLALDYLKSKGYSHIQSNFTCHWGEIDIIVKAQNTIVFCEVKTRVGLRKGYPYEAVNRNKIKHLGRAIEHFLLQKQMRQYKLSLDVISIVLDSKYSLVNLKHYQNIEVPYTYV